MGSENKWWTPEPWRAAAVTNGSLVIIEKGADEFDGDCIVESRPSYTWDSREIDLKPSDRANADRIVACVNALAGINPEAVPELLEACVEVSAEIGWPSVWVVGSTEWAAAVRLQKAIANVKGETNA